MFFLLGTIPSKRWLNFSRAVIIVAGNLVD
jgi:hypothetical protein